MYKLERDYPIDNEMLDNLYVKYVGKNLSQIKENGTADEIIRADLIRHIFDRTKWDGEEIAEWIGCEIHPDDKTDETDDENSETGE